MANFELLQAIVLYIEIKRPNSLVKNISDGNVLVKKCMILFEFFLVSALYGFV